MFKLNFKKKNKVEPLDKPLFEVFYFIESNRGEYHIKISNDPIYKCRVLCIKKNNIVNGDPIQYNIFDYKFENGVGIVGGIVVKNFGEYIDACLNILKGIILQNNEKVIGFKKVNQYRYDISETSF